MLLFDVGNSRLKWSELRANGTLSPPQFAVHEGNAAGAIASLELPPTDAVWVASVVGDDPLFGAALKEHCGITPRFARVEQDLLGLHLAYAEPGRLGVDRWLAMLGLWSASKAAFCVTSAGTALTFDAVDDAGQHQGGFIAPGLITAQQAVDTATRFEIRPRAAHYVAGLGQDTESCVRQGALYACLGAVERASRGTAGMKVLTGGDAGILLPHLGRGWEWKPNAVLEGLRVLSQM